MDFETAEPRGKNPHMGAVDFLAVNCLVSAAAVYRWSERLHDEPPKTWIGSVMDARFPNERMERIYANMNFGDSE